MPPQAPGQPAVGIDPFDDVQRHGGLGGEGQPAAAGVDQAVLEAIAGEHAVEGERQVPVALELERVRVPHAAAVRN